jgi:hypothetical protein
MVGALTDCPHCGQQTDLLLARPPEESAIPRRAILWTVGAIIVLGLGLAGSLIAVKRAQRLVARHKQPAPVMPVALAPTNSPETNDTVTQALPPDDFSVSEIALEKTAGSSLVYAVGTVKNPSRNQRFGVKIQVALFDAAGQKVGTATDYRQILEPNADWRFKALVVDSKAVSAKLESIKED